MGQFNDDQWQQILASLNSNEIEYGLPPRHSRSLVFSSFNIRKFGRLMSGTSTKRSAGGWMLAVKRAARWSQWCPARTLRKEWLEAL